MKKNNPSNAPVPFPPRPLRELKPALLALDSIGSCPKCSRRFDAIESKVPSLLFCSAADIVVAGVTYEGEHIHRTCPFCKYGWKEKIA